MERFPGFSESFLQRLSTLRFKPKPGIWGRGAGEHLMRKGGASVEFSDFRTYSWGDDFRLIDWNSFARLDRPFVKVFRDEEGIVLHFLLDCSRSMDWGDPPKIEYALRVISAFGYVASMGFNWVKFQSLPEGYTFPESRGRGQILNFFRFLSQVQAKEKCHLTKELEKYAELNPKPSLMFILTDALEPTGIEGGIRKLLTRGHQVVFLHVLSPEEVSLPFLGDLEIEDLEWGSKIEISLDDLTKKVYRETVEKWINSLRFFCLSHQIPYVFLPTSLSFEELFFRKLPQLGIFK